VAGRQKAGSPCRWRGRVDLDARSSDADERFVEISEHDRSVAACHRETNCAVALVDPRCDHSTQRRRQRKHASAVVGCDGGGANVSAGTRRREESYRRERDAPANPRQQVSSQAPRFVFVES
jgi:hypothetical protein